MICASYGLAVLPNFETGDLWVLGHHPIMEQTTVNAPIESSTRNKCKGGLQLRWSDVDTTPAP